MCSGRHRAETRRRVLRSWVENRVCLHLLRDAYWLETTTALDSLPARTSKTLSLWARRKLLAIVVTTVRSALRKGVYQAPLPWQSMGPLRQLLDQDPVSTFVSAVTHLARGNVVPLVQNDGICTNSMLVPSGVGGVAAHADPSSDIRHCPHLLSISFCDVTPRKALTTGMMTGSPRLYCWPGPADHRPALGWRVNTATLSMCSDRCLTRRNVTFAPNPPCLSRVLAVPAFGAMCLLLPAD